MRERTDGNTKAKAKCQPGSKGDAARRSIVVVWVHGNGRAINQPWVVVGHVHDGRAHRSYDNVVGLVNNVKLLRCPQVTGCVSTLPHHLHRVQHVLGLVVVGITQLHSPLQVLVQLRKHLRKCNQRLDTGVPRLGIGLLGKLLRGVVAALLYKLFCALQLCRVSSTSQNLRHQGIRV